MKRPEARDTEVMDRFARPIKYAGYKLCDPRGQRIGKVEEVFVSEFGNPQYVRVSRGRLRASILLPVESVAVDTEHMTLTLK